MTPLERYMNEKKLKPAQLARLLGVSAAQVSLWTHGRRKPSVEMAGLIEERTGGDVPMRAWVKSPRSKARAA